MAIAAILLFISSGNLFRIRLTWGRIAQITRFLELTCFATFENLEFDQESSSSSSSSNKNVRQYRWPSLYSTKMTRWSIFETNLWGEFLLNVTSHQMRNIGWHINWAAHAYSEEIRSFQMCRALALSTLGVIQKEITLGVWVGVNWYTGA